MGVVVRIEEASDDVLRWAGRFAIPEGDEDHLVAVEGSSIPAAVLSDEGAALIGRRKIVAGRHGKSQGSHVGAQGVVRHDRFGDQIGPLRLNARIEMLTVVAVRPAVEPAILH